MLTRVRVSVCFSLFFGVSCVLFCRVSGFVPGFVPAVVSGFVPRVMSFKRL